MDAEHLRQFGGRADIVTSTARTPLNRAELLRVGFGGELDLKSQEVINLGVKLGFRLKVQTTGRGASGGCQPLDPRSSTEEINPSVKRVSCWVEEGVVCGTRAYPRRWGSKCFRKFVHLKESLTPGRGDGRLRFSTGCWVRDEFWV